MMMDQANPELLIPVAIVLWIVAAVILIRERKK